MCVPALCKEPAFTKRCYGLFSSSRKIQTEKGVRVLLSSPIQELFEFKHIYFYSLSLHLASSKDTFNGSCTAISGFLFLAFMCHDSNTILTVTVTRF